MVFVLDKSKKPLDMITNADARILLRNKQAVVDKVYPFTIRLKDNSCGSKDRAYTVKLDPGSKHTGIAIVDDTNNVVMLAELEHRGHIIKRSLDKRRAVRRSRRQRKTRYRPARFLNRTRPYGWLAPSVKSRADNVINFIKKYKKLINIDKVMIENVSFDVSQLTSGTKLWSKDYQQGNLYQTKLRSFIFSHSNSKCVYCGAKAAEIDHVIPRSNGGTNSTYNLVASCRRCNEKKSNLSLKAFGKLMGRDYSHLEPKKLPKDAAIVQSARNYMISEIAKLVPDTTTHDAWLTKYNRDELDLPKEHYYDALSVGEIPTKFNFITDKILVISAKGRGSRQMCSMNKFGFPRTKPKGSKSVKGFQTGDIVKAVVHTGSKQGEYLGRVVVRSRGEFNIQTNKNSTVDIGYKYCRLIQRGDGYSYNYKEYRVTTLQRIVEWNEKRGLLDKGFDKKRETSFLIEEILEFNGCKGEVKELARQIAEDIDNEYITYNLDIEYVEPNDQDIIDGLGDLIIFATGAMAKKLKEINSPHSVDDIINLIMDANDKKGSKTDAYGKITKDKEFTQPKLV